MWTSSKSDRNLQLLGSTAVKELPIRVDFIYIQRFNEIKDFLSKMLPFNQRTRTGVRTYDGLVYESDIYKGHESILF